MEWTGHRRGAVAIAAGIMAALAIVTGAGVRAAAPLPSRLTDQQLWSIVTSTSEPSGTFHSENLVSNEIRFQETLPTLVRMTPPGRAYVGVGSEQNFTYIAAVKPTIAFIVDLRRGNLDLHLAYKALFEMSADRAEFISRLFSRPKPTGLGPSSTAEELFAAFEKAAPSEALFEQNLKAIDARLTTTHGFALTPGDLDGVRFVYRSWFDGGPDLRYELTTGGGGRPARGGGFRVGPPAGGRGFGPGGMPTYAELMTSTDGTGHNQSYLSSEERFAMLKDFETRNLVVPIVGNFGGAKALRGVAAYLKAHDQIVSAFYVSNVEQYLRQDSLWDTFCANAATLPIDAKSVFVRSERGGAAFALTVTPIAPEVTACTAR